MTDPFCGQLASFPSHLCYCSMVQWMKWPWWQRWQLYMGSATWMFTHQDWTWLQLLLSVMSAKSRHQYWVPDVTSFPGVTSDLVASWLHWITFSIERAMLCSYWNRFILAMDLPFFAFNASAKTSIHGLMECFIHHNGIAHSIDFEQGSHFVARAM